MDHQADLEADAMEEMSSRSSPWADLGATAMEMELLLPYHATSLPAPTESRLPWRDRAVTSLIGLCILSSVVPYQELHHPRVSSEEGMVACAPAWLAPAPRRPMTPHASPSSTTGPCPRSASFASRRFPRRSGRLIWCGCEFGSPSL